MAKRFGLVTFSSEGHLNPSITLATALVELGHEVVFYCLVDGKKKVERAGFPVRVYGEDEFTEATIQDGYREMGRLSGMRAVRHTLDGMRRRAAVGLRDLPSLFQHDRLDGVIVDQVVADGAAVARAEQIPYVTLSNALPINLCNDFPPVFSCGLPGNGPWPWIRNRALNGLANRLSQPLLGVLNEFQRERRLPIYAKSEDLRSSLAQVTQIPAAFDFPSQRRPSTFHYSGPFHNADVRPEVDFPWDRLDPNRPLVYASMGTLQNQLRWIFRAIAEAGASLPIQLVISLGGSGQADAFEEMPGDPIVVPYAPQLKLLDRADLCITHAGLNTAMESLARGVPMLAIPVTNDQPGVASRIHWGRTGCMLSLRRATSERIRRLIELVLIDLGYRENARSMQRAIASIDGAANAAAIIEQALVTGKPVERVDES